MQGQDKLVVTKQNSPLTETTRPFFSLLFFFFSFASWTTNLVVSLFHSRVHTLKYPFGEHVRVIGRLTWIKPLDQTTDLNTFMRSIDLNNRSLDILRILKPKGEHWC